MSAARDAGAVLSRELVRVVLAASLACNSFFLVQAFGELRTLRDSDRRQDVELARLSERTELHERYPSQPLGR